MYKELAHELQKPNPDTLKIIMLLVNGRPQNFFDKILNGLFYSSSLGLFADSQEDTFFHSLAEKGILSPILYTIDYHKKNILEREDASLDDLCRNLNAVNNDGLTPAHIAVKTDPVALRWLVKFKAALTSKDYSTGVLSVYTNHKKINNKSPLEYIFEDDEITKNVFLKIIKSGNWDLFDLFTDETPIVQEKFKKSLKHIPQIANEFKGAIAENAFYILFQRHWENILVDEPEFLKVKRLINVLDGKEQKLTIDWYELLGRRWDSMDEIKSRILLKCAAAYLKKFNKVEDETSNDPTLQDGTLEQILYLPKFDTKEFQAIKDYVEGVPDNSTTDNSTNATVVIAPNQPEKLEERPVQHDTQDTTPKSDPITIDEISIEEVDPIADKENRSSTVNHISTSKIIKNSTEFKPEVDAETFAQKIVETIAKKESRVAKLKEVLGQYSELHVLVYASSNNSFFETIFNAVANYFKKESREVPFRDVNNFLEEYTKTLSEMPLMEVSSKSKFNKKQGLNAYDLACEAGNYKVAELLAKRSIELKLYTEDTAMPFKSAVKYNCKKTIKYLGSNIHWYPVLYQAIRYINIHVIKYCFESADIIKDTISKDTQHTIFNDALSELKQSLRILVKYDGMVTPDKKVSLYEDKISSLKKIPQICEIIEFLVSEKKVSYGAGDEQIATKTYELLSSIIRQVSKISGKLEESKESGALDKIIKDIKDLLHYDCGNEIREDLDLTRKILVLIFDEYPSHELKEPLHKQKFENLKSGIVDENESVCGTSVQNLSVRTLSEYGENNEIDGDHDEISGDVGSVYEV